MHRHAIALLCALYTTSADAEPGGTSTVYGPTVERGESELEYRGAVFNGGALDGAVLHRAEAGYAFTDWWRPAFVIQTADMPGASTELTSVAIENVFDFSATRSWPVHFGGYAEYAFGQNGRDHAIELKLLAERRAGPWTTRVNLVAERHVGDGAPDDWEYGYAARAMWRANERWALCVEGFGEPEAHAHYWGPRASFRFGEASIAAGYLAGLDDAQADGQFRLTLELER
jgi:hypothetical protein